MTASSSSGTSSRIRSRARRGRRLEPAQDAGAVDVRGAPHFQHPIALPSALELLARIHECLRRREEVDADVVLEYRERADVASVPLIERHTPLDGRLRIGDALPDEGPKLLEHCALVGRLLGKVALHGRTGSLLRRGLLGGSLGCDHLQLLLFWAPRAHPARALVSGGIIDRQPRPPHPWTPVAQ